MRHHHPEFFFLIIPWALLCLMILLSQNIALQWLQRNISARFRPRFTRYTPRNIIFHLLLIFLTGTSLIWILAEPFKYGKIDAKLSGKNIFFIVDSSYSMFAQDNQSLSQSRLHEKTRFEAALEIVTEIVSGLPQNRIGFISFSGNSVVHFLPTPDQQNALALIKNARIHSMRHTGSDFSRPLKDLIHAANTENSVDAAVILSDGEPVPESNIDELSAYLKALQAAEIPVFTIGLGGNNGSLVDLYVPEDIFNNIENPRIANTITTKRDEKYLQEIAEKTGGKYFNLENGQWIDEVVLALNALPQSSDKIRYGKKKGTHDLSEWPLSLFLFLFIFESVYLFPRAREKMALLILFWLCASCQNKLYLAHLENENGIDKYDVSLFEKARTHFEISSLYRTREEIPLLNLGNNYLLKKEYNTAHTYFQQAIHADPEHPDAYFNDGVAFFQWAEDEIDPKGCFLAKAAELFDQSIARFEEAEKKGRVSEKNIDYVKKRILDIYALRNAAKDCPETNSQNSYTSKYAPPPEQPPVAKSGASSPSPAGLTPQDQQSTQEHLERIKKETHDATDFKQTQEQQRPTDSSEIDKNLYW